MIRETGALDVYFEDSIEILEGEDPVETDAIREVLTDLEVDFSAIDQRSAD